VIYYWAATETAFYMLYAYAKNEQGDLTTAQLALWPNSLDEEFR
jgi:hypothetical protein